MNSPVPDSASHTSHPEGYCIIDTTSPELSGSSSSSETQSTSLCFLFYDRQNVPRFLCHKVPSSSIAGLELRRLALKHCSRTILLRIPSLEALEGLLQILGIVPR